MYDTILVPTDGSDPANRAVEHALDLAEHYDATLHALYVVDTSRYGEAALSSAALVLDELEAEGTELVERIVDRADNKGLRAEHEVCHGVPHEEIVKFADEIDADVLVMGYQGKSHEMRTHMGSVADRVVRGTDRPVLVV